MNTIPNVPLTDRTVWTRDDILARDDWRYVLSVAEIDDVDRALAHARGTGKDLVALTRDDFPLPVLTPAIAGWMKTIQRGAGFQNVAGLPAERYSVEELGWIHYGIGLHLGTTASQNAAGDLLGHVRDVGANANDRGVRLYKTNVELGFHSDGADIAALLCVRPSKFGGSNRLASCGALYNEFARRRPDLVEVLYRPFPFDRNNEQGEGEPPFFELPVCSNHDGNFRMFYIGWYIRHSQRHPEAPRLSAEQVQALDLIDEIASEPDFHFEFRMEPGEINYLKNSAALHMRTAFEDFEEPERKRHLLRLWLNAHGAWADGDAFVQQGIPVKEGVATDAGDIAASDAAGGTPAR